MNRRTVLPAIVADDVVVMQAGASAVLQAARERTCAKAAMFRDLHGGTGALLEQRR